MRRDWHRAIYIPAPKGISSMESFQVYDGPGQRKRYTWGENKKDDETLEEAIEKQKTGYTQIAGSDLGPGSARRLLERMIHKTTGSSEKEIIFQSRRGGALKDLKNPNTVLYIDCHGNSQTMGFRPYGLSPEGLSSLIAKHERLPKTIKFIKLFACYSGEEQDTDKGDRTGEIFARQFSAFMTSTHMYTDLTVYGYLGELFVGDDGTRISKAYNGVKAASANRRAFKGGVEQT